MPARSACGDLIEQRAQLRSARRGGVREPQPVAQPNCRESLCSRLRPGLQHFPRRLSSDLPGVLKLWASGLLPTPDGLTGLTGFFLGFGCFLERLVKLGIRTLQVFDDFHVVTLDTLEVELFDVNKAQ